MNIINIGILAHVDAGKTTLTESLLYASGAISEPGSVEKGTTRTDTLFLERQRGITIQAAVTSFQWHRCKVNIVDLPGMGRYFAESYICNIFKRNAFGHFLQKYDKLLCGDFLLL